MRSLVFSFKKRRHYGNSHIKRFSAADLRCFLHRYALRLIGALLLIIGLAAGSIYAENADSSMMFSLDFLFTTNLEARLSQNMISIFCACFASDFIFLFAVFLLGLAPWGILLMPAVALFKGFGTGLTAGYLFITYGLKGAGFYLLVLLPGTFLFCLALVTLLSYSFAFSKNMFGILISRSSIPAPVWGNLLDFCSRSVSALLMTFLASMLDSVLWTLFAGTFNF